MKRPPLHVLVLLCAGLLAWTLGALRRSLWTDEFHSLHHARSGDLATFFESVRSDNHPPLSFFLQRLSIQVLGESELALRLPSIVAGVVLLLLLVRLGARLPEDWSRWIAPWLAVLSSYLFAIFTDARMYSWLALAVLGLVSSVLDALEGKRSRSWVAVWIALGLHAHYYFFHYLFVIGACVVLAGLLWRDLRGRAAELALPASIGAAFFLPWAGYGFFPQLFQGLPPGGHVHGFGPWASSFAHFFFTNASLGGGFLVYVIALPGAALVLWLGVLGTRELWRSKRETPSTRRLLLFTLGAGIVAPAWCYVMSLVLERAAYNWTYVAGSAAPVVLLVAAGISNHPPRVLLAGCALGPMLAVTLSNAVSGGVEDWRSATEHVLGCAQPGDAVLVRPLWDLDPAVSPTGWDFYLARSETRPAAPLAQIAPLELGRACQHPRVWTFTRDQYAPWVLNGLRARFGQEKTWRYGRLELHLFERPRSPAEKSAS